MRTTIYLGFWLFGCLTLLNACEREPSAPIPASSSTHPTTSAKPFSPDTEPDAINYTQLVKKLGAAPAPQRPYRLGAIMKYLGNPYWQTLADGMAHQVNALGLTLDVRAAASESDPQGQAVMMRALIDTQPDALFISPQSDTNLAEEVALARKKGIVLINVDDAVLPDAEHFVGPNQYENGIRAARYLMHQYPQGGAIALIKGLTGVYAVTQRSQGLLDTLDPSRYPVVAIEHGDWDLQKTLDLTKPILQQHPNLIGIYCNNDVMALGATEAVRLSNKITQIAVIGTDGIAPAYASIQQGNMRATVDSFPFETGMVAVDVAVRLLQKQPVPKVVYSPQNLIARENLASPLSGVDNPELYQRKHHADTPPR
jgi:ribose transport system substrate-binding protein